MPTTGSRIGAEETSRRLFLRARRGDASALGRLLGRYLPDLRRWTHGRLPQWARTAADTSDFVQDAALGTIRRFKTFDVDRRHALAEYLRTAVQNRLRDEHRRIARRGTVLDREAARHGDAAIDPQPSPFDYAVVAELEARYRAALLQLSPADHELLVGHIELGYTHDQLACMTGRSRNAARMALQRAVRRLAEHMGDA